MATERIGILISGRGSNMEAIIDATHDGRVPADVALVISNIESAGGLAKAKARGVETVFIDHRGRTRTEHDADLVRELKLRDVTLVCLAGYMRLVSPALLDAFRNRVVNIHPSLLPAFPGLDAQKQALEYGVKLSGCTVHLVDEHLDHGPILLQRAVEVNDDDTIESLSLRILEQEHTAYAEAIEMILRPEFSVNGRRCLAGK